jgi:hypothetical protein
MKIKDSKLTICGTKHACTFPNAVNLTAINTHQIIIDVNRKNKKETRKS